MTLVEFADYQCPMCAHWSPMIAELLRKYTTTVFLLYDSDRAGLTATFRAGDVLLRQGLKVHVVTLPDGEDPDTFVLRHGREKLEAQLADAIDVFERKVQILQRRGFVAAPESRRGPPVPPPAGGLLRRWCCRFHRARSAKNFAAAP